MSRFAPRPPHLRRLTVLAFGMTTALTLTACGGGGDGSSGSDAPTKTADDTPRGVVTKQVAKKTVDTYEHANNRSNAKRDAKLLGTVEAGQVHEQSKADFAQWETWSKEDQEFYASSFYYKDRDYLIPSAASGVTWFAVKARSSADPDQQDALLVFDKAGGTYKLTMAVYADGTPIPDIDVDKHGFVTPLNPSTKVGTTAPDQLGHAYEDFFETGGKNASKTFAPTATTKTSIKVYKRGPDKATKAYATKQYFAKAAAHPKVYALKLANGAALTVFPTAHTSELMLKPQYLSNFDLTPSEKEAVYNPSRRDVVTDEFQGQALAILDPKGKPRVTALEYRMVDSR